jgi:hypothetical protein
MQILLYLLYAVVFVMGAYILFLAAVVMASVLLLRRTIRDQHECWSHGGPSKTSKGSLQT